MGNRQINTAWHTRSCLDMPPLVSTTLQFGSEVTCQDSSDRPGTSREGPFLPLNLSSNRKGTTGPTGQRAPRVKRGISRTGRGRVGASPALGTPTRTGRGLASAARALPTRAQTPGAAACSTAHAWPASRRMGVVGATIPPPTSSTHQRQTTPRTTRLRGPTRRARWRRWPATMPGTRALLKWIPPAFYLEWSRAWPTRRGWAAF